MAQRVKNPPAMQETQETQVRSLGREDPLGGGHGNPLQYPCLENPMDGGAWWAAVHGVTKSRTRLSDFTFTFSFLHCRQIIYCLSHQGRCESWTIKNTAAAAKLLQLCLTLCDPIDGSPPGSPIPGILQARILEWVASFSNA